MSARSRTADESGASRRKAYSQIAGNSQLYYDTELEHPVVLRQNDGWGSVGKRDYLERTWTVERVRCYLSDSGCEVETISQSTKLTRTKSGRYQNISDEDAEGLLEAAVEANRKWLKVNSPHLPYDGEGGVNVYADGERLKTVDRGENEVVLRDGVHDAAVPDVSSLFHVRVGYDESGIDRVLAAEDAEEFVECEQTTADGVLRYRTEIGHPGLEIELRHDTECVDPHEWTTDVEPVEPGETA